MCRTVLNVWLKTASLFQHGPETPKGWTSLVEGQQCVPGPCLGWLGCLLEGLHVTPVAGWFQGN